MKVTILGCGPSAGVPRIGNDWGACDPSEPRNRRRRGSILVEAGGRTVLVDTSPDLREQLLDARVRRLDGVIYTHEHADQTHGIDDLRALAYAMRGRIDVWADPRTMAVLHRRFDYVFDQLDGSPYPPIAVARQFPLDGTTFSVAGLDVRPFRQMHGDIDSVGLRFGPFAYSNDVNDLPEESFAALAGVEVWIVDALRYRPHPTHAHLDLALAWIDRVKPRRAVLTNLHVDLDYNVLQRSLPTGVEPAYDGMVIEVSGP